MNDLDAPNLRATLGVALVVLGAIALGLLMGAP